MLQIIATVGDKNLFLNKNEFSKSLCLIEL